jgi:hypothetical protein
VPGGGFARLRLDRPPQDSTSDGFANSFKIRHSTPFIRY